MAVPEELLRALELRRRTPIFSTTSEPDAVAETMSTNGLSSESVAQQGEIAQRQQQIKRNQAQAQVARRTAYRKAKEEDQRRRAEAGQKIYELPISWMSDDAVDAMMEQERKEAEYMAHQPQIRSSDLAWSLAPETRRALGYYTQSEREQAARMNDVRSNTFFGSVMPNFGRQMAYYNPGAEWDAFKGTATYLPYAFMSGLGFGVPSATTAAAQGLRTGWQTAANAGANLGYRTSAALANAATQAGRIVTNPRWIAPTMAFTVPMAASAADGIADEGGVWNWIANNPEDVLFWTYVLGRTGWKGMKAFTREPTKFTYIDAEGKEVKARRPKGERVSAPEYKPVEILPENAVPEGLIYPADPNIPTRPSLEAYGVKPPPSMRRPQPFSERILSDPGPMPTAGKKLKQKQETWKRDKAAYDAQQQRISEYNQRNQEAVNTWNEYESPEQVAARQRYAKAVDDYNSHASEYKAARQRYEAQVADYQSKYNQALKVYNETKKAEFPRTELYTKWKKRDDLFDKYYNSDKYKKYLYRKDIPKNIGNWFKNNWFDVLGLGIYGGIKLFEHIRDDKQTNNTSNQPTQEETVIDDDNIIRYLPAVRYNPDSVKKVLEIVQEQQNQTNDSTLENDLADW